MLLVPKNRGVNVSVSGNEQERRYNAKNASYEIIMLRDMRYDVDADDKNMDGQTVAKANIPNGTNALKEKNQGDLPGNESKKVEK